MKSNASNVTRVRALRLFEQLDGLDDDLIRESALPIEPAMHRHAVGRGHKPSLRGGFRRALHALNSVPGVAVLCTVLTLGIVLGLIYLGTGTNDGMASMPSNPPGDHVHPSSEHDRLPTETLPLPAESERVPVGTRSVDENGLRYVSYGDGTCYLLDMVDYDGQTTLSIADYSPDGDVVVSISPLMIRSYHTLTEVTLPAGLRSLSRKTFPANPSLYTVYGNLLYLGSSDNPYMVAVGVADACPGAVSLHPDTRIVADYALTYETGADFCTMMEGALPAYQTDVAFTIPSGLVYVGRYGLLDVGRDVTYGGTLVEWDALNASEPIVIRRAVAAVADGTYQTLPMDEATLTVTVTCMDGTTTASATACAQLVLDSTAHLADGILYGSHYSEELRINEDYYAWCANPTAFNTVPNQFIVTPAFGTEARVLTADELSAVRMVPASDDPALAAYADAYNRDPNALYAGLAVVMLYLRETLSLPMTVADVTVTADEITVTVTACAPDAPSDATVGRVLLIPINALALDGSLSDIAVTVQLE